jgi:hypothetical protein
MFSSPGGSSVFSVSSRARWAAALAVSLAALGQAVPDAVAAPAAAGVRADVRDDFNGDGYADLAVAAPGATVAGASRAGYVAVMYGGPHGLSTTRRTVISRATTGIPGSPVAGQTFGAQLSRGDLDGDGYADLVVASGGNGAPVVVWGGPGGLSGGTSVPGRNTQTGDFDGDGRTDLALFTPRGTGGDDPGGTTATVWSGPVDRTGTPAAATPLTAEQLAYLDVYDGATGDVNGDGYADLVVTGYGGDGNYGSQLYLGSAEGLAPAGTPVPGGGLAVALGDVNGDGCDDVVAGVDIDERVDVAYGSPSGVTPRTAWTTLTQDTPGVPGATESNDRFGAAVAVGDITGDGIDDIAVGVPGEWLGDNPKDAGMVDVLRGGRSGVTGAGAQGFTQNTAGVPGTAETGDVFGAEVRLVDVNGNGYADLAAAAPGEDDRSGAVWSLRGRPTGIVTDAALVLGPRGIGAPYAKAGFGTVLK